MTERGELRPRPFPPRRTPERYAILQKRVEDRYSLLEQSTPTDADIANTLNAGRLGRLKPGTQRHTAFEVFKRFNDHIIYQDDDLLVVNKPPFITAHSNPDAAFKLGMTEIARRLLGDGIAPANRLDNETSGLMVMGKNKRALLELMDQFSDKDNSGVRKMYAALLEGSFPSAEAVVLEQKLIFDEQQGKSRVVDPENSYGLDSTTIIHPMYGYETKTRTRRPVTLAGIELITGRTHQIRVGTAANGTPVVGDRKYNVAPKITAPRQMLHAVQLELLHPKTGKPMKFQAPTPADFNQVIGSLELVGQY